MSQQYSKFLKKLDIFLLILFPIIAVSITLFFKLNYLGAILAFFVPLAVWLSFRTRKMIIRTALFSLIFIISPVIILNYLAIMDGSWYVPTTIFTFRLLNVIPFEDIILFFLLTYDIVICYEHFLDKGKHHFIDKKMKYLIWPVVISLILFFVLFSTHIEYLKLSYMYFWIGVVFIFLPIISTLSVFPKLLSKYIKVGSYFSVLLAMFEYSGVSLNHWVFPGKNFIGWVSYFGHRIPIEELILWIFLITIAILSYYEFFDEEN